MSRPPKRTSPSARAPGTVSCMRLRQRSSVDLPQPDGPMIAVTSPVGTAKVTSRTTRDEPKYASSDSTPIAGVAACAASLDISTGIGTSRSAVSVTSKSKPASRRDAGGETDDEDESEEDERARPGLCVPAVVG